MGSEAFADPTVGRRGNPTLPTDLHNFTTVESCKRGKVGLSCSLIHGPSSSTLKNSSQRKIQSGPRMAAIRLYFMNPNLIDLYGFGLIKIASLDFVSGNRFLRIGLTLRMEIRGFISKCVGVLEN